MRVTDERYNRDRLRLELALRLIGHEARTHTIRHWTGLSDDRIRKLFRAYIRPGAGVRRRRGKSPQQASFFVRSGAGAETAASCQRARGGSGRARNQLGVLIASAGAASPSACCRGTGLGPCARQLTGAPALGGAGRAVRTRRWPCRQPAGAAATQSQRSCRRASTNDARRHSPPREPEPNQTDSETSPLVQPEAS